ncbi:hypothetical protein E2562_005972 [Oryza meyeriana var. granulata]|uniref:Alpha/beta hydrolase fold-3 domain-containing protein n=1 Tax=Oryza meyeriana var. granulata TaxID=110450 RepID=A0A6G1DV86_9ORYZ|nr:hypothetical protein E2562_005972 [Oryza meyeriana var. granulata]
MSTNKSPPARNESGDGDIAVDLLPFLRVYKDGRIKRFVRHTFVPTSDEKSSNGIVTKDVVIDDNTGVSVRLFLPVDVAVAAAAASRRLPLVVYIHGGAFCSGSASAEMFHRYAESLAARAAVVVVSVDYRLAPDHPMPAGYDDGWAALSWAVSRHSDPWVSIYADTTCTFLAGESAGANIVHNHRAQRGVTGRRRRHRGHNTLAAMLLGHPPVTV